MELVNSIRDMLIKIDNFCSLLIVSDYENADLYREPLKLEFASLISAIIKLYEKPDFEEVKEDRGYWINQFRRIEEALSSYDVFFITDVLKNETAENMRLFLKMLQTA